MNNKRTWIDKLSDFISGKGFYLVVLVCVAAIALSGWYLVQGVRGGLGDTLDQPVSGSAAIADRPYPQPPPPTPPQTTPPPPPPPPPRGQALRPAHPQARGEALRPPRRRVRPAGDRSVRRPLRPTRPHAHSRPGSSGLYMAGEGGDRGRVLGGGAGL